VTVVDDQGIPWSVFAAEATRRFDEAGFEHPELDARRIVERAAGLEPHEYSRSLATSATQRGVAQFDRMVARRLAGEPLQYVVGVWGFRQLELLVDRRVLIPRPETEVLVEHALSEIDRIGAARVVDLGTGSGAIALSLAFERASIEVWATDVSTEALDAACANLAGLGRHATRVRLAEGSWFDALPPDLGGRVDVIVSNPPYVAERDDLPPVVADWEPEQALIAGPRGTEVLEVLIDEAPRWLAPGGAIVLELAPWQAEPMADRAGAHGYVDVRIEPDLVGRDRVLIARRPH
jgi:release factor glutamine methyltransferase